MHAVGENLLSDLLLQYRHQVPQRGLIPKIAAKQHESLEILKIVVAQDVLL